MILLSSAFQTAIKAADNAAAAATGAAPDNRAAFSGGNNGDEDDEDEEEDPLAWNPKKILTTWTNEDGIDCVSIIFQLSGGATLTDSNDVEVQVNTLGNELAVSEVWNPIMANARNFYQTFPKHDSESEENAMRKSIAMCDRTNTMAGDRQKRSIYKMKLPFRVDPSVKRIRFLGTKGPEVCYC
jgi:hypothetical protein